MIPRLVVLRRSSWSWWALVAALLAASALLGQAVAPDRIDWRPALAAAEPWRAWSAVAVHYSRLHLVANLTGLVLVAWLGVAAGLPARSALAWWLAWPLTQGALLSRPDLVAAGGLSGVLHAGVAVAALHLLLNARRRNRWIGGAVLAGLVLKVVGETPWGPPLRHPGGWDIAVAPAMHAAGLAVGLGCGLLTEAARRIGRLRNRVPPAASG